MLKENKKVKNATPITAENINFNSKLELSCYRLLVKAGFNPVYEGKKTILQEKFNSNVQVYLPKKSTKKLELNKTIREISYNVDFYFSVVCSDGVERHFFIEAKGMPNDAYPIKKKLFIKTIQDQFKESSNNVYFFEVRNLRQINQAIEIIKSIV